MKPGRTAIFLSVRDKATRLPGKVMRVIQGRRAIEHLIDRLKRSTRADSLVMTTSTNPGDDGLACIAAEQGIGSFRGSEEDKLRRYLDAAEAGGVEFCVVVDGDDLFADPACIDRIVDEYKATGADYIICDDLPVGVTGFGVKIEALRRVVELKAENDTEVWGGYFTQTGLFRCRLLEAKPAHRRPDLRMTLDYPEDLAFFEAVFAELYRPGEIFSFDDVMELLARRPDIARLNAGMKERYEAGLGRAAPVRMKAGATQGRA